MPDNNITGVALSREYLFEIQENARDSCRVSRRRQLRRIQAGRGGRPRAHYPRSHRPRSASVKMIARANRASAGGGHVPWLPPATLRVRP